MNATDVIDSGIPAAAIGSLDVVDGDRRRVAVTWVAGDRRGRKDMVDLSPLIDTHKFYSPLRRDPALFTTVRVIDDGYAIAWGDGSIDMSAASVERLAEETMTGTDFGAFLQRNALTHHAAAAALGRSKRQIENYLQAEVIPRIVVLACIGYEARRLEGGAGLVPSQPEDSVSVRYFHELEPSPYGWRVPVSFGTADKKAKPR